MRPTVSCDRFGFAPALAGGAPRSLLGLGFRPDSCRGMPIASQWWLNARLVRVGPKPLTASRTQQGAN